MTKAKITGSSSGNQILESYVFNENTGEWDQRNPPIVLPRGQRNNHQIRKQNHPNRPNHQNYNQIPIRDVTPSSVHHHYHNIDPQNPIVENTYFVRPGAPDHPPPDFYENYQNVHPHHPQYPPHYGGQDGGSGSGHRN